MTESSIIQSALPGFEKLLASVDVEALAITSYAKRYLRHIIGHKIFYCRMYAQLLDHALQNCAKKRIDICVVDYGAGNGVMGLLAKYCGFGKVFINDLNGDFLHAAAQLAAALQIQTDGFIEGDVEKLTSLEKPDAIVGSDVIEHIYDLDHFFTTVAKINPAMITVMSTASNQANPFKVKELKSIQLKDELYGGTPGDHDLFGETAHEPFFEIRKKIIEVQAVGNLKIEEINILASLTRGLRKDDIEKAVDKYTSSQTLPVSLTHPTNTCDPITGSWSERLLSFEEYKTIYSRAGFEMTIHNGFYDEFKPGIKGRLLSLANSIIPFTGHLLSPYIVLIGKPVM